MLEGGAQCTIVHSQIPGAPTKLIIKKEENDLIQKFLSVLHAFL